MDSRVENLAKELRNIGPVCAEGLIAVGVNSYDDLAGMGACLLYTSDAADE